MGKIIATTLGALVVLATPALAAPAASLTDGDNGSVQIVKVGDTVKVSLTTGSDGGYRWVAAPAAGVAMVGEPVVEPPKLTPPMVGGMSKTVFTFRMTARGTHVVKLAESRPWEKGVRPIKTFQFTMKTVSPAPVRKPRSR